MVSLMLNARKISLVCFLVLTIFFSILLGYTLFVILWTRWLTNTIQVFLNDIKIDENSSLITFYLTFKNPSSVHCKITFIRADVVFNKSEIVVTRQFAFTTNPLELPANAEKEWHFSAELGSDYQPFLSNSNIWSLHLRFDILTPFFSESVKVYRSVGG